MQNRQNASQADPGSLARRASLTVECAMLLPLFFLICVALASFMDAVRLQTETNLRLAGRAREAAALAGGAGGQIPDGNWIDLGKNEPFQVAAGLLPVPEIRIAVRARVYPWIGGGFLSEGNAAADSGKMVFVTEHESVFHTHADCTHLDLAVRTLPVSQVREIRNVYGDKYRPCRGFPKGYNGMVYFTEKGDYYYPTSDYGALTRHVRLTDAGSCEGMQECGRCRARDEKDVVRAGASA